VSLRARLTLLYGGLLGALLLALGLGAQALMQGRFADETRSTLTSAAQWVYNNYTLETAVGGHLVVRLPAQHPFSTPDTYFEIVNGDGTVADQSLNLAPATLPLDRHALRQAYFHRHSTFEQVTLGHDQVQVYYTPFVYSLLPHNRANAVLVVGKSLADISRASNLFSAWFFGGEATLLVLVIVATWLITGSALRPIKAMTAQAASIAETRDFAGRVPVDSRTAELQRLALTFNHMLESLQEAYANQQRFLADASHELRTPLTVVQGNLHYLEAAPDGPVAERADALHAARIEADRMGVLVGDLLALSQADAGQGIDRRPVELDRIVLDAYRRIKSRETARDGHGATTMRLGRLDEVLVEGDESRLLQLVLILLDNAVKYTPANGEVTLELAAPTPETATICIADTGPGIPEADRERIFDRFYRSPSARASREGSGLGLAIGRWIARAHGGDIEVTSHDPHGSRFVVTLPRMPEPAPTERLRSIRELQTA